MDEVRLAIRRLTARPAATIASVITLAFAIGAAAATWSLLSAVLLRPLPVRDPDRLVVIEAAWPAGGRFPGLPRRQDAFVYPFYPAIRDSGVLERVAAHWTSPMRLLVNNGEQTSFRSIAFVSHDFFDVLGVAVPFGRGLSEQDDRRGAPPAAVLSHAHWRAAFDAAPGAVGRTITIAGRPATIVGVAARGFRGLNLAAAPEIFLPLHTIADIGGPLTNYFADPNHQSSPTSGVGLVARLDAADTPAQALARLSGLERAWDTSKPAFALTPINVAALPQIARDGIEQFTRLLGATVIMLLLIGCSGVGMLLLLRTEARREELATCLALGASRARLARGIALEGAALATAGALLAVPVGWSLFAALRSFQLPGGVDLEALELGVDSRAVAAAVAGAVGATVLIGLLAVSVGFPADLNDALRSRSGATPRTTRRRTRTILVSGQVAVALVLVAGAGLFGRSLTAALALNPELETGRIVSTEIRLSPFGYTPPRASGFFDELRARLEGNPAIHLTSTIEGQGGYGGPGLLIDGVRRKFPFVAFTAIDDAYFATLGIRIAEGRGFSPNDVDGAPLVGIASRSFGRLLADDGNPIGKRITMPYSRPPAPPPVVEIVGVVSDLITSATALQPLNLYVPIAQTEAAASRELVVRAAADADAAKREVLSAIRQIDRAVTPGPLLTIDERLLRQMAPQRLGAFVLGALGLLAMLLTLLGTYVLTESLAVRRLREMGIRAALGARGRQLARLILAETARLVGVGLAAGYALAWLGASTIRTLLFRIDPLDPITLIATSALIAVLAAAVSLRPALRAARVDLVSVLRSE